MTGYVKHRGLTGALGPAEQCDSREQNQDMKGPDWATKPKGSRRGAIS